MIGYILPLGVVGMPQVILIVVIVLILFGGKKIPELMKGLGKGISEFKKATQEDEVDDQKQEHSKKNEN